MVAIRRHLWLWLALGLGILVVAAFLALVWVRLFVISFSVIPQNGMYPSLPAGSRVFALNRPYFDVSRVAAGDVVLFERQQQGRRYIYISRVAGLPGETVTVDGDELRLNGELVVREKVRSENDVTIYEEQLGAAAYEVAYGPETSGDIPDSIEVTVPEDHVFVISDNRRRVVDSRMLGPIPFSSIVARKW